MTNVISSLWSIARRRAAQKGVERQVGKDKLDFKRPCQRGIMPCDLSDVKALLKHEEFVKRMVKQCFYSAFELNESHIRTTVSRSIENSLKDI